MKGLSELSNILEKDRQIDRSIRRQTDFYIPYPADTNTNVESESDCEESSITISVNEVSENSDESTPLLKKESEPKQWKYWKLLLQLFVKLYYSKLARGVLKSMVAFVLAISLVFCPYLRIMMYGYSTHMAAVTVITFGASGTVGNIIESVLLGVIGILFGVIVSIIGISIAITNNLHDMWWITSTTLLSILFVSTFILAYFRAKSQNQAVITGTSLAQLIIAIIFTNYANQDITEFDTTVLWEIVLPILYGTLMCLVSSIFIFPTSAASKLRDEMCNTIDSLDKLLTMMTRAFLLENIIDPDSQGYVPSKRMQIENAVSTHHRRIADMSKMSGEAKLEFWSRLFTTKAEAYKGIIESLGRLTQHMGGMKSGVLKQSEMVRNKRLSDGNMELLHNFIDHIGPSLRQLCVQCKTILHESKRIILAESEKKWFHQLGFHRSQNEKDALATAAHLRALQQQLDLAMEEFELSYKDQLKKLYKNEKFDGKPNDEVFLVFFFIFCGLEFAKELKNGLLNEMEQMKQTTANGKRAILTSKIERKVKFVDELTTKSAESKYHDFLQSQTNSNFHQYLKSPYQPSAPNSPDLSDENNLLNPNSVDIELPGQGSFLLRHRLKLWRFLSDIGSSFELKFALKTAIVVTAVSLLAYLPETKNMFMDLRVHWSILTTVMIMVPSVGGTNISGLYRILGTVFGVAYAYGCWTLFPSHDYALYHLILTSLFALPCFIMLDMDHYPRVAQVSLVAICSVLLSYFANLENEKFEKNMLKLAYMRGTMVLSGIGIGLLATWYLWPYEARVELRKGMSDLLINLGILYSRLVQVFQYEETDNIAVSPNIHITPDTLHNFYYTRFDRFSAEATLQYFMAFEGKIQLSLMKLNELLPLTWLEPRLKGPFPVEVYREMITSCQNILDKFVAMRVAIANNVESKTNNEELQSNLFSEKHSNFFSRDDMILGVAPSSSSAKLNKSNQHSWIENPELLPLRREMVGSVLLSFYIFAGSLIIKQPLPTYLPSSRLARKRLLKQIQSLITDNGNTYNNENETVTNLAPPVIENPQQFINYYAYALAMEDVILELEKLGALLKNLFGELFADVIQHFDVGMINAGQDNPNPVYIGDEVDIEISNESSGTSPSKRASVIPIHHHRNDKWGNERFGEIDGIRSPRPVSSLSKSFLKRNSSLHQSKSYSTFAPILSKDFVPFPTLIENDDDTYDI